MNGDTSQPATFIANGVNEKEVPKQISCQDEHSKNNIDAPDLLRTRRTPGKF